MSELKPSDLQLEREKWEAERGFRERELAIKEREQLLAEEELKLKRAETAAQRWRSPLIVAVFAAAVAAAGNAVVTYINGDAQTKLESLKSEQTRILEMIKTGNPERAAQNLRFLLEAGLISNPGVSASLAAYLDKPRAPGSGPVLPSSTPTRDLTDFVSQFEGSILKPYTDPAGLLVIGSGHALTEEERSSGKLHINGKEVTWADGITTEQAKQLLQQDLEPYGQAIDRLVSVQLTANQKNALVSLAYQIGLGNFERSALLKS